MPERDAFFTGNEIDAIYRARLDAQVAARALISNDGMHDFGGTQNGIHGAGLDTFSATDTFVFTNPCHHGFFFYTVLRIERLRLHIQQVSQCLNSLLATRRAFIDRITVGNRFGVGSTAGIATLPALGLREQRIDLIANRIALDSKANCGKAQKSAEGGSQTQKCRQCSQQGLVA